MHETGHPKNIISPETEEALSKIIVNAGNFTNGLPVALFAGQAVPPEGLCITPPGGGELTVWADGRFLFEIHDSNSIATSQAGMNLYYSYLMEDEDGTLIPGTMSVRTPESETTTASSQAWSIHEMLDMEASLTSIFNSNKEEESLQEFVSATPDQHSFLGTDLLDYLFKASHQG